MSSLLRSWRLGAAGVGHKDLPTKEFNPGLVLVRFQVLAQRITAVADPRASKAGEAAPSVLSRETRPARAFAAAYAGPRPHRPPRPARSDPLRRSHSLI